MPIRVLVNGAHGKMGTEAVKAIKNDSDLILAGEADHTSELAYAIKDTQADVVVDFTVASVAFENTRKIIECNVHPVIGTSGLSQNEVNQLSTLCAEKGLGGLIAPNFSIGATLMMHYAAEAAKYFPHVEIIEMHHNQKIDAPSGTAIRTAELIAEKRLFIPEDPTTHETAGVKGARGAIHKGVRIHAVRIPGVVANEDIIFGGEGETLLFRHGTLNRSAFMPGVCLACKKVPQLTGLLYGLEHILNL